jgi:hypothetical protein
MRILGAILVIACATHSCSLPPPALSGVVALDLSAERMLCETVDQAMQLGLLPRFIAREAPCYRAGADAAFELPRCVSSPGWQGIPFRP